MRVDAIQEKFGDRVRIEWKSFMLRTEPKTSNRDKFVAYTNSWQRCAETEPEAEFTTPWASDADGPSSSLPAQVAWKAAATFGDDAKDAMKRALMHAYFVDNRNISDHGELVDIAVGVGLDRAEFEQVLAERGQELAHAVVDEHNFAITNGITAVPTVLLDGMFPIPGAQEVATYERMVERMIARKTAATPEG